MKKQRGQLEEDKEADKGQYLEAKNGGISAIGSFAFNNDCSA